LAPDGELTRLPWAALPGSKKGTVLLHDYEGGIAVVPHGPYLLEQFLDPYRPADKPLNFLAVGAVKYDLPDTPATSREKGYPYLPDTAVELAQLKHLIGNRKLVVLEGHAATPARVREELPRADLVHLGTHGFFDAGRLLEERRRHEHILQSWNFRSGIASVPSGLGRRSPLAF